MRRHAPIAIGIVAFAIVGCDARDSRDVALDTFVVRDSAGITIVENPRSSIERAPLLDAAPDAELTLGSAAGDADGQLFRVRGFTRLSDGTVVVLNAGTHEVRFYSAAGVLMHAAGGRGSGPGEFGFPVMLLRMPGDTTCIFDLTEMRFTLLDAGGTFVRARGVPRLLSGFVGFIDDGTVVTAEPRRPPGADDRLLDMPMVVRLLELDTGRADTIAVTGARQEMQQARGELAVMTPVPFTVHAAVRVRGRRIYITDGVTPEVRVHDAAAYAMVSGCMNPHAAVRRRLTGGQDLSTRSASRTSRATARPVHRARL